MRLTILSDNRLCENTAHETNTTSKTHDTKSALQTEHGFSCLVETSDCYNVLFDLGQNNVFENAKVLGKDLSTVDCLVLSHGHYDHTGGLATFLEHNRKANVVASNEIFSEHYSMSTGSVRVIGLSEKNTHALKGLSPEETSTERTKLFATEIEIYNSGQIKISAHGNIGQTHPLETPSPYLFTDSACTQPDTMKDEIILVLETERGLFLVTGCCHAGFINMCQTITNRTGKHIYGILGGFHLEGVSEQRLEATRDYIRQANIQKVYPCHCTGDKEIAWLENELPGVAKKACLGNTIVLNLKD